MFLKKHCRVFTQQGFFIFKTSNREVVEMIDQKVFAKEMDQYWTKDLRNVSSDGLRKVWYQQAKIFIITQ